MQHKKPSIEVIPLIEGFFCIYFLEIPTYFSNIKLAN